MLHQQLSFQQHSFSLIHYKNCIFHGQIKSHLKQNVGILILDNGEVLIGNFKNDQLNGDAVVFLDCQTYVIGTFSRGMLDGTFVLRNPKITVYWTAKMNKIQGEIIVINYESMVARNWIIENGEGQCTNQISLIEVDKQNQILQRLSPNISPYCTSVQFLQQRFSDSLSIESSTLTLTSQISLLTTSSHKLKLVLFKDKLIEYGVYHQNQLNGLGYLVEGTNMMQGKFKNGKLDGNGLKMDLQMEKIIFGTFHNGDIRTIDIVTSNEQTARKELKSYKKQQHIFSLQYQNNYFNERPILMLANFLKTIQENDANFTQEYLYQEEIVQRNQRSFQKSQDQILTSAKLNLGAYRKDKKNGEKYDQNGNKSENFTSRFKKNVNSTSTKYIESGNKGQLSGGNTQFLEGINEVNRINKALRKFK